MSIVLIVEDQPENQDIYTDIVYRVEKELGLEFPNRRASTFEEAQGILERGLVDPEEVPVLILLDMEIPFQGHKDKHAGYRLMEQYRKQFAETCWVPLTAIIAWHEKETPGEHSLFDKLYELRPFAVFSKGKSSDLKEIVRNALKLYLGSLESGLQQERATLTDTIKFNKHLYAMSNYKLYHQIRSASENVQNILLFGEPGTGKKLTAELIHYYSKRQNRNFRIVDGMLDVNELEELLFPMVKKEDDNSLISQVQGGTLYISDLDQIGRSGQEESLRLQRKLLHFLKYKEYDMRIIAGINSNRKGFPTFDAILPEILEKSIALDLPSLNDRKEDIPVLVEIFLKQFNSKLESRGETSKHLLDPSKIYKLLQKQEWQNGNIARLRLMVEEVLLKTTTPLITVEDFERVLETHAEPTIFKTVQVITESGEKKQINITKRPLIIDDDDLRRFGIR